DQAVGHLAQAVARHPEWAPLRQQAERVLSAIADPGVRLRAAQAWPELK
ncbi:MAG: hypothetical protein HY902_05345, partial [Deltaproteobacteria bacterium]|nr:hypothetical protein [Deltaproteobacteria bacterium]